MVVVIAAVLAYVFAGSGGTSPLVGTYVNGTQLAELKAVAMNNALANNIGVGTTLNGGHPNYPNSVKGNPLIVNGKAGVVYVGADYCPFCAVTRWGLIIALMRFGNVTGLKYMQSSHAAGEPYPNTPTFTFSNSTYSSGSAYFDAVETETMDEKPLGTPDALEAATFSAYGTGAIPFVDFGNSSVLIGATITPQVLDGKSWSQIISLLNDSGSPVALDVIGSADVYTAAICKIDAGVANTSACQQPYVKSINGA